MSRELQDPIPWRAIEDAISDWVTRVLGIETQWTNQSEPQPARPFAWISIDGPTVLGLADEWRIIDLGGGKCERRYIGQREITITVTVEVDDSSNNDPSQHARNLAGHLQASLHVDEITADLEAVGLGFREPGPVTDVSLVVADQYVGRASIDYRAGLASSVALPVEVIEGIEGVGQATKPDGSVVPVPIEVDSTP